ncbi:neuronal acetylcholine receptor subunit alpha-6-like [Penaeus japonicus]|uniref:neuronal acetylcholine receptor subunit alpha-6-like n=1 Tax=Penaeus japonicus TaxID=27405 RepID=UPI001C712597|nr:neuronal acetylcholine receptor subunit alpha-6-like [Penaeus japonicus]XP_042894356.1 neuronal acetylcholine receptor subunit alpha-6-like [Penaeus japonicus]
MLSFSYTSAGILGLLLLCNAALSTGSPEWARMEERLRKNLFSDYDRNVRPSNTTMIAFNGPTIRDVHLDDTTNAIEMFCWLRFQWQDDRLKWNASEYEGVETLSVPVELLWTPDVAIFNAHSIDDMKDIDNQPMVVTSSGSVLWIPPARLRSTCGADLKLWPHDTHVCNITIGSWTQSGLMVDFDIQGPPDFNDWIGKETNMTGSSWEILEANSSREAKHYPCCPEVYVDVLISLKLRRYAPSCIATIFVPAVCLSLLTLLVFLLPPAAGEKVTLGGFCLVLDLIFLIYVSSVVGIARSTTPILVKLACQQFVLAAIGLMVSVQVVRLARGPRTTGLTSCIRRPLSALASCLFLGNYGAMVSNERSSTKGDLKKQLDDPPHYSQLSTSSETTHSNDYLVLAAVVDRLLFLLFLALCLNNVIRFWSVL